MCVYIYIHNKDQVIDVQERVSFKRSHAECAAGERIISNANRIFPTQMGTLLQTPLSCPARCGNLKSNDHI